MSNGERPWRYSPAELDELLIDPGWADDQDVKWLIVNVSPQDGDGAETNSRAQRLASLPIPLIGVAPQGRATALAHAMDVLVESEEALNAVLTGIRVNPTASAVLVQLLRSVDKLPMLEALALESLAYATLQSGVEFARWLSGRKQPFSPGTGSGSPAHTEPVLLERRDSHLEIALNAPHNRNALSTTMRDGLTEAFKLVALEPAISHVHVRANGPSFSSGGDLTEFGTATDPSRAHGIRMRRMPARYLVPEAARYHFCVHGACIGAGIELAAFAGRLTASDDAFFQLPEVGMGLIPGAGGCVSIPHRIGRQRTAFLALTGQRIDSRQALAWGLVDALDA